MERPILAFLCSLLSWKAAALIFAILNIKNLPLVWHYRFLRILVARLFSSSPSRAPDHHALFLPAITRSHAPMLETDYNLHKSNSTYLSDVDMSRANLGFLLFQHHMAKHPHDSAPRFMLGGVVCVWRKEIKSYKTYEMWSRTLTWDDKWLYVLTTFVESGAYKPKKHYMQKKQPFVSSNSDIDAKATPEERKKGIFASTISRVVFKKGRKTIRPVEMITAAGLMPAVDDIMAWEAMEEVRKRRLDVAQLKKGWDAVHDAFLEETDEALGVYTDLFWP